MTPSIYTLIPDIQELIKKKDGWFTPELSLDFSASLSKTLLHQYNKPDKPTLRLSGMGPKCPCALWHSIHHPELAEPLPAWAEFKFSFGHIIEAQAIMLAKAAGHIVTGEQDELVADGIKGHRDCVIDGCIVDVKSCSGYQFQKYKSGRVAEDDSFGYLDQLDGYILGSVDDPLVTVKDRGYILAIDKTLGHMCLYEHKFREDSIRARIQSYKTIVGGDTAPKCTCGTVPDGKSGNIRLDTKASYSPYKWVCFPHLRQFNYSSGPVYLSRVIRTPDVQEVNKYGKTIFH